MINTIDFEIPIKTTIFKDGNKIQIYRARESSNPRQESIKLIGIEVNPEKLLADLRTNIGVDTVLGLPAGPNSGLSGKLIM